jgi:hypothetical protein
MSDALSTAKNPNTSLEQLQKLLSENEKNNAIVSAIAVHPNMTKDLLIELALNDNPYDNDETDYFYQTDKNPNIDSLLLKYSNLVEDIYVACLDELPEFYEADPDPMDGFAGSWEEYSSFFYRLPNWFVEIAIKHSNEDLRAFVAGRVPLEQHEEQLVRDESGWVRYAMAGSPNVSDSALEKLAQDEDWDVKERLTKNENTSAYVLLKLAQDENIDVRIAVAENARCRDRNYFWMLGLGAHKSQLEKLAEVKNDFASIMEKLSKDEDSYVRKAVARNDDTPTSILKKLSEDENADVREAAVRNNNFSKVSD